MQQGHVLFLHHCPICGGVAYVQIDNKARVQVTCPHVPPGGACDNHPSPVTTTPHTAQGQQGGSQLTLLLFIIGSIPSQQLIPWVLTTLFPFKCFSMGPLLQLGFLLRCCCLLLAASLPFHSPADCLFTLAKTINSTRVWKYELS